MLVRTTESGPEYFSSEQLVGALQAPGALLGESSAMLGGATHRLLQRRIPQIPDVVDLESCTAAHICAQRPTLSAMYLSSRRWSEFGSATFSRGFGNGVVILSWNTILYWDIK